MHLLPKAIDLEEAETGQLLLTLSLSLSHMSTMQWKMQRLPDEDDGREKGMYKTNVRMMYVER